VGEVGDHSPVVDEGIWHACVRLSGGGGDTECDSVQLLSPPSLGPCGHSRVRWGAAGYSGCGGEKRDDVGGGV